MEKEKHLCSVSTAPTLDNKLRKFFQNPRRILKKYVKPGMKVLDFGCATGLFSREIAEMGAEVIAADVQQEMLDILREKIKGKEIEKRIKLVKCEENDINVNEKVDLIVTFYVVHEVPDIENLFRQFYEILNKGGRVFIAEPKFHTSKQDFQETQELALKQGFKIIDKPKSLASRVIVLEK